MTIDEAKLLDAAVRGLGLGLLFGGIGFAWYLIKAAARWLFAPTPKIEPNAAQGEAASRGHSDGVGSVPNSGEERAKVRARQAARQIVQRFASREDVSDENRVFYDFVVSAAQVVLDDPRTAARVGGRMAPWG